MLHNFSRCLEASEGFETNYLKVMYYDLSAGFEDIYRSYEYSRICTIMEGEKEVTINNGSRFTYTPKDFIYLPPHSTIDMKIPVDTKAVVYELDNRMVRKISDTLQNTLDTEVITEPKNHLKKHHISSIAPEINRINSTLTQEDPDKGFLIDLMTQELIYNMLKSNFIPIEKSGDQSIVEYILMYMHSHISEPVSFSSLSREIGVSPSTLTRKFKEAVGYTPVEYFNRLKMKKAKEMLRTHTVTEICFELGFGHISHFISLFKKYHGITPKQYALKHMI